MERKLYKLVKNWPFYTIVFCVLFCRLIKKELCLTQALERVTPAIQSTSTNIWWPMAMISSGTVSGFMKKTNTIYRHEPSGPVRKNEVPVLYGYSQDLGV